MDTHTLISKMDTEADTFIIMQSELGTIKVVPYWECNMTNDDLDKSAFQMGIKWADTLSEGAIDVLIIDLRNKVDIPPDTFIYAVNLS